MSNQSQSPTSGRESAAALPISEVENQIRDIQLDRQYESRDGGSKDEDMPLVAAEKNVKQAPLVGENTERDAIPSADASHVGALKKMF